MSDLKSIVREIPLLGPAASACARWVRRLTRRPSEPFPGSKEYWERRYADGGNSGRGSYGELADFKAEVLNAFVEKHAIKTVVEFGCGDGNQLVQANYPHYVGLDVSQTAVEHCRRKFAGDSTKEFVWADPANATGPQTTTRGDLAMSLDVIYHLIEDAVFEAYMRDLFASGQRYVIIYASNTSENPPGPVTHVRHRKFTEWVDANADGWRLIEHIPNRYPMSADGKSGSFADFYIFEKS